MVTPYPAKGDRKGEEMKITVDKNYTSIAEKERVQQAIKDFKVRYTDNDILNAVYDVIGESGFECIALELTAFPQTICGGDITFYLDKCVLESYREIIKVNYIGWDENLTIREQDSYFDDKHVTRYERV